MEAVAIVTGPDRGARPGPGPSDEDLASAFENAPIGMAVLTPAGVITACNPAMERLLDRSAAELVGSTFFEVTHPDDLPAARRSCTLMQSDDDSRVVRQEARFRLTSDRTIWVSISTSRVPATADRPAHLIMHIEDVTDRKLLEAELSYRALHDPLTGLANRALLTERLGARAGPARPARPPQPPVLPRPRRFQGRQRPVRARRRRCRAHPARPPIVGLLRAGDTAARLGGDEFAVLCEDAEPQHAAAIADRLSAAAAEPFVVDGMEITLSAAVGSCPAHLADPADLLREADRRMYETKQRRVALAETRPQELVVRTTCDGRGW